MYQEVISQIDEYIRSCNTIVSNPLETPLTPTPTLSDTNAAGSSSSGSPIYMVSGPRPTSSPRRSDCLITLMDQRSKFQYDRLYFVPAHHKIEAAKEVSLSLQSLADILDMNLPVNIHYIQHKKGILLGAMASFFKNQGDWLSSRHYAEMAVNTMGELLNNMEPSDADFSGFAVEYIDTGKTHKLTHIYKYFCLPYTFILRPLCIIQ